MGYDVCEDFNVWQKLTTLVTLHQDKTEDRDFLPDLLLSLVLVLLGAAEFDGSLGSISLKAELASKSGGLDISFSKG